MAKALFFLFSFISMFSFSQENEVDSIVEKLSTRDFFLQYNIDIDSLENQYLYHEIYEWIGTTYKYAGNSKEGIDCSGFSKMIYSQVFCSELSGGSRDIWTKVNPIEIQEIQEGDLVFFKIWKNKISHVGVYLRNNKFAHASTQLGVIISDLDEDYYKKYFYSAGRLKEDSF